MVNSSTLLGFAMLKANFNDKTKSFQDNFVSFVVDSVKSRQPDPVSADEVSVYVNERFGLDIPSVVARSILGRAKSLGMIKKVEDGKYECTSKELRNGTSITADMESFVRRQNQLSDRLLAFVKETFPDRSEGLNREECGKLVARYMDVHALPLLQSGVRGGVLQYGMAAQEDYLVAEFVAAAHVSEPEIFDLLVEVAKGATLAAVLKMDVSSLEASLDNLWVYVDTSIALGLLGHHGEAEMVASREILRISGKLGVKMCVFEHTVNEMRSILTAAQHTIRSGGRASEGFKVAEHFLDTDQSAADIEIIIARIETNIESLGLQIREKPAEYHQFGLDEMELDRLVGESISYQSDSGRRYDVDSIAAVHQLRQGKGGEKIERARALFITRNRQLVIAANKARESNIEFPLALLEPSFASLLWVRRPSLAEGLPEKRVLATAWAGMQPEPARWMEYLAEADKMVERGQLSPEDALLLRLSTVGRHELMRSAQGDPAKFVQVKPSDLLDRLKQDLSLPLVSKIEYLEGQKAAAEDEASTTFMKMKEELVKADRALQDSIQETSGIKQSMLDQRDKLYDRAYRHASRITLGSWIAIALVIATIGVGSEFVATSASNQGGWPLVLILGGALIATALAVLGICGVNVSSWTPRVAFMIADRSFNRKLNAAGLAGASPAELQAHRERHVSH